MPSTLTGTQVLKRTLATIGVLATLSIGWATAPMVINSREASAITDVYAEVQGNFQVGALMDVQARFQAPPGSQPHDVFTLYLPEQLVMKSKPFSIREGGLPEGSSAPVIADCRTAPDKVSCTFTDYLADHNNVPGIVKFQARIVSMPLSNTLMWRDGVGTMFITSF